MLQLPESLSIILTYKCNAKCDYCCFESNSYEKAYLNLNTIKKIISHSKKLFTPKVVVFTGGEPTLYLNTLIKSINFTRNLHIPSRIVTNCWWAKDAEKAETVISKLVDAGLTEINFSTGTQHQRFIDFKNVKLAIDAAIKFKLRPIVVIEEDENADYIQNELVTESKSFLNHFKITRFKKVYLNSSKKENIENGISQLRCNNILQLVAFSPDNIVYPCCGLPIRKMHGFELCKIDEYFELGRGELLNLLYNFQNTKILVDGPYKAYCEQTNHLQSNFHHNCVNCYELYKNSNFFNKEFEPNVNDKEIIIRKLALLSFIKKRVVTMHHKT